MKGWRDPDERLQFWKNVHGLNFSSMAHLPLEEASVEFVRCADLATERCLCQDFNIETVKDEVGRMDRVDSMVLVRGREGVGVCGR